MKAAISGNKRSRQEATAVRNPKNGELTVSANEIKKVILEYCVDNLKNNTPKDEVRVLVEERRKEQKKRIEDTGGEGLDISKDDFNTVLNKCRSKDTKIYDFLLRGGKKYQQSIFQLCKRIINNEEIPESFRKTILFMIWKRKYPMNILNNNRFIHLKNVLPRIVEALTVNKMKDKIINEASMYQIGGVPGHEIEEHVFTIKSIMAMREEMGTGIIFTLVDIIAFFDKEDIYDCMDA